MKYILIFLFFVPLLGYTQSPTFKIDFKCEEIMYHGDTCSSYYRIIINQYKPINSNSGNELYMNDTSLIDWNHLNFSNLTDKYNKINLFNDSLLSYVLIFTYSLQDNIYENIFEFIITRTKCNKTENMRFYFPIKISSLFTDITIIHSYFIPGDFNLTNDIQYMIKKDMKQLFLNLKDDFWINNR